MKRATLGGTHRGPVQAYRQRRTLRFVQLILILVSGALMLFAGYSFGRHTGFNEARARDSIEVPRKPSLVQPVALVILGGVTILAALVLERGGLQPPTPARLDELVGRAEGAAIDRAERPLDEEEEESGGLGRREEEEKER